MLNDLPPVCQGIPVKLLSGNLLLDARVTGQNIGFVSISLGTAVKLVRRHEIYVLPGEQPRLEADLKNGIHQLETLLEKIRIGDDPVAWMQE